MKLDLNEIPRTFYISDCDVTISDMGKIKLDPDELVSFITESGKECDFVGKDWGFYPTSSINGRLKKQGFKTALVRGENNKIQLNVIEEEHVELFKKYLDGHKSSQRIIAWLDDISSSQLDQIEKIMKE